MEIIQNPGMIVFLLMFYLLPLLVSSFETKSANLGANITKIARKNYGDDFFYVGGDNFVAAVTSWMDVAFYVKIGPVHEEEHCPPMSPIPCVNTVTVLEIDEYFNQLIVCGSAYGGTCTMHSIPDINYYVCLHYYNNTGSNVVSSYGEHRTLAHFLTPRPVEEEPESWDISHNWYECRSREFGMIGAPPAARDARDTNENPDHAKTDQDVKHDFGSDQLIQSRLMIASFHENGWSDRPLQPLISMRYISNSNDASKMMYAGENFQAEGIFLAPEKTSRFKADFQMSFIKGNHSYFLSVQSGLCSLDVKQKTCTILSRTNNLNASLLPYIEVPLDCKIDRTSYPILTASVVGTVGLQQASATLEVTVLILAFARGSKADPDKPDNKLGTAICAYPLDTLDNEEFDYGQNVACPFYDNPVPWTDAAGRCQLYRAFNFGGSVKAVHHIPQQLVTALFTHTQTTQKGTSITLIEKMYLYTVHPEVSSGFKLKKHLEITVYPDGGRYKVMVTKVPENIKNNFQPAEKENTTYPPPIGTVDHSSAIMYLAYGKKVFSLKLDFCRQYRTCTTCRKQGSRQCIWCPSQNTCMDKSAESCPGSSEGSCPPRLDFFNPSIVPVGGGSILTIKGRHLGKHDTGGNVTVSICGQPCDNVIANVNSLSCKVRPKPECPNCDKCYINVTVTRNKDSNGHGTSSSQIGYVESTVTKFEPTFGPLAGGTHLTIWGDNLFVGNGRNVTVAGVPCDILEAPDDGTITNLACKTTNANSLEEICGPVTVQIDGSIVKSKRGNYCFKLDPVVLSVNPLKTIESGGITLLVEGKNFNNTHSIDLVITIPEIVENNEPAEFRSHCLIMSGEKMTCEAPNMERKTKPLFYDKNDKKETTAAIKFDMGNTLAKSSNVQHFSIHRNPVLFLIEDKESTLIHRKIKDFKFKIKGNYIPEWMNVSDVIVMVGKTRCDVENMTEFEIRCNVRDILKAYRKDYFHKLRPPTVEPYLNTTVPWITTEESNFTTDRFTPVTKTFVTSFHENSTLGPTTELPPNMTRPPNILNKTNISDVNAITSAGNGSVLLNEIEHYPHRGPRTNSKKPLPYLLTVQIGNWEMTLGIVKVGPPPRVVGDPSTEKGQIRLSKMQLIYLFSGIAVLIIGVLVVSISCYVRQKRRRVNDQQFYMGSLSARTASQSGSGEPSIPCLIHILHTVLDPTKREAATNMIIKLDQLQLGKNIGSGNFGCVYEGTLTTGNGPQQKVAIKTLQEQICHSMDLASFVQEAVIMMDFHHEHVLGLVGLSEKEPGIPYVILPYMENGDLLTYIRNPKRVVFLYDVIQFAADICSGMSHLSSLKFVHRDLAARNCMLDKNYRVKVADFGLCRDIYEKGYYTSDNKKKLPIRWMAVESIESGAYSTKSDVWSMGVVMWELLTRGLTPYPGVNGWDIINFLRRRRLEPPFYCPENMYRLMMNCWAKDPALRPTFKALQKELLLMIGQELVLSAPTTPEPTRNQKTLVEQDDGYLLPQNVDTADSGYYPIPIIKINQGEKTNKSNQSNGKGSKEKGLSSSVMSLPRSSLVKNAKITFPVCYEYRDVKKFAVADYLQLVDNYETAPRFSNPFMRSKKRRSKTGKTTSKEKNSKELKVPHLSGNSGKKTNSASYALPAESAEQRYVIPRSGSEGKLIDMDKVDGGGLRQIDIGNYFELEHNKRASNISVLNSTYHSSVRLDKTASLGSLLDRQSGASSMAASSCQSLGSSNSSRNHQVNRTSEINMRPSHLLPQEGGRFKTSSLGISSLKEEDVTIL